MRRPLQLVFAALASLPATALAQEFNVPKIYVWGNSRPATALPGDYLVNMIMVDSYGWFENQVVDVGDPDPTQQHIPYFDPITQAVRPEKAARRAAWEIMRRLNDPVPDLTPEQICITFNSIGRDFPNCDVDEQEIDWEGNPLPNVEGNRHRSVLRFFTELDRLPGLNDNWFNSQSPAPDNYFPVPDQNLDSNTIISPPGIDPPVYDSDADPGFWASNRAYRHPFLINAGDAGVGLPTTNPPQFAISPFRDWMIQFVMEYQRLQTEVFNGPVGTPNHLPNPAMFYLDTEPQIVSAGGGRNEVHMLWWIAQNPEYWGTSHTPGRQVPGYPPGTDLFQLYRDARLSGAHSLPVSINDPTIGPDGIRIGIERDFPASHPHNRPFMAWWEGVCLRAQSQVVNFCVYDVVKSAWPADPQTGFPGVKCGNYADCSVDLGSSPGNTGWFMDWQFPYNPEGSRGTRTVPSQRLPRGVIPGIGQSAELSGVGAQSSDKRYLLTQSHSAGDVSQPVLYHLNPEYAAPAHRQINLYRPHTDINVGCGPGSVPHPSCETDFETSMRLIRHTSESVIESYNGGQEGVFVPWIQQAYTALPDTVNPPEDWIVVEPEQLEDLLLMLRAKNTPEIIFWTGYNSDEDGVYVTQAAHAWETSSDVAERVYAPRVEDYSIGWGTEPPNATYDPSKLEFTLTDGGFLRTIELSSEAVGNGYSTGFKTTIGDVPFPASRIRINVESAVDTPGVVGLVLAWDFDSEQWFKVFQPGEPNEYSYSFWAPNGMRGYESRAYCEIIPQGNQEFVSSQGKLVLAVVHMSPVAFKSAVDLVQVVGYAESNPLQCPDCMAPLELIKGDFDLNGEITPEDLLKYLEGWAVGSFFADMDQDNLVGAGDLVEFLDAYEEGM